MHFQITSGLATNPKSALIIINTKMHKRLPSKGLSTMEKRVPKSDKYSHIQSTLDTGMTVAKVKFVTAREYSKRRDEIFFRITKSQVYELYNEYEADEYESIAESRGGDLRIVTHSESAEPVYSKPYLILDVRDTESFNTCHLLQARSFPYTLLRRDQLHPEIYKFRNKPETLIIVYCDDEKISRDTAKLLVDRGTDNVYLLTGGMSEFASSFPAFLEGIPPSPKNSPLKPSSSSTRSLSRIPENSRFTEESQQLTPNKLRRHNGEYPPVTGSSRMSGRSTGQLRDTRSESGMSMASTGSVAESVISRAASRKGKF